MGESEISGEHFGELERLSCVQEAEKSLAGGPLCLF